MDLQRETPNPVRVSAVQLELQTQSVNQEPPQLDGALAQGPPGAQQTTAGQRLASAGPPWRWDSEVQSELLELGKDEVGRAGGREMIER